MFSVLRGQDLLRTTLLIVFLVALAYFFPYLPLFFLMALLAALVAISLSDGALMLEKFGIPHRWGVMITLLASILVLMGLFFLLSSPFYAALKSFLAALPDNIRDARPFFREILEGPLGRTPILSTNLFSVLADWFSENAAIFDLNLPALFPPVGTLVWQLLGAIIIFMVVIATGIYMAMTPLSLLRISLRLFSKKNRDRALKTIEDLYNELHAWPVATILSMVAVGIMTTLAYWLIGLPHALLLGTIAGLLEIIPYVGVVIAAIPTTIVAATVSETHVFLVLITLIVVQTINRTIIIPSIMSRVVRVHPAVIALSVLPIYWVFGVLGIFLVVPICIVGKVLIRNLWIERPSRVEKENRKQAVTIPDNRIKQRES